MLTIYAAGGCPYAHRSRALLKRLDQPVDLQEIDLTNKPPDFLTLSPLGKVPLIVDGDLKLCESLVINDYLVEKLGWKQAYAAEIGLRARQRLSMVLFDSVVMAAYFKSLMSGVAPHDEAKDALLRTLHEQERTVEATGGEVDNLFGIHCATHWVRMQWLGDEVPFMPVMEEFVSLTEWLDDAAAMPHVQATLPDREKYVTDMRTRFMKWKTPT